MKTGFKDKKETKQARIMGREEAIGMKNRAFGRFCTFWVNTGKAFFALIRKDYYYRNYLLNNFLVI